MLFIIYKPGSPWFLFHVEKWLFFPEEWVSFAVKWANSTWKKWPKWKHDSLIAIISCYTCLKHCHFCSKQNETDIIIHIRKKITNRMESAWKTYRIIQEAYVPCKKLVSFKLYSVRSVLEIHTWCSNAFQCLHFKDSWFFCVAFTLICIGTCICIKMHIAGKLCQLTV